MSLQAYQPLIFVSLLIIIFFLTKQTLNHLATFIHTFIHHEGIVFSIIAIIFLPGTIIHEVSHAIMALILFLEVRSISILPSWRNNRIKLGSVEYVKKDVLRSILVGIAPLLSGIAFFWIISQISFKHIGISLMIIYLMYVVSTTMFSSKQDMADFIYSIPILIVGAIGSLLFKLPALEIVTDTFRSVQVQHFFNQVNMYLFFSIGINFCIIMFIKLLLHFKHG